MKRILLVEDNVANRKLLGEILRSAGHEVHEVGAADAGIAAALAETFHLVVMDVQLPGIDGLTATRLLRADPHTAHLPVLAVTAHAMRGDEKRILEAGCDGYVAKPIAYRDFLGEVTRLLAATGSDASEGEMARGPTAEF
jgi:two-component system cell cycle response regulator DivK